MNRSIILVTALSLSLMQFPVIAADSVAVPIFASYALMQQLMQRELFKSPDRTAVYPVDKSGCTKVTFANPQLSGTEGLLDLRANLDVKLGLPSSKKCTVLNQWVGSAALKGAPIVVGPEALAVQFKVVDAQVFDAGGMQLKGGLVQQVLQSRLHPLLDQYKLDLQPLLARAKAMLPSVLQGYSKDQLTQLFDSFRLGEIKADAQGLNINLLMDRLNPEVAETMAGTALKNVPKSALPDSAQDWDTLLSLIVKQMSRKTDSQEIREALLEVLQDARKEFKYSASKGADPLKHVFMNAWERLAPIAQTLSHKAPHQDLLQLVSYVSAADVFKTLDALADGLGVDISGDGLQKMLQLLNKPSEAKAS